MKEKTREEIQKLTDEVESARKNLVVLRERLEDARFQQELPELNSKYLGKFFKYRNSYGNDCKGWWLYTHVLEIKSRNHFIVNSFQITPDMYEFKIREKTYGSMDIEITEQEYKTELKKFISATKKLATVVL